MKGIYFFKVEREQREFTVNNKERGKKSFFEINVRREIIAILVEFEVASFFYLADKNFRCDDFGFDRFFVFYFLLLSLKKKQKMMFF